MLLANVNQRCYFRAEMSHRRGALGAVHHHRRSPRHVRPDVREGSALVGRYQTPTEDPGFGGFFCSHRPSRSKAQGREADCDCKRESRPDVKAPGRRGEEEECDFRLCSRDTAPPSDEDVLCALFAVKYGRRSIEMKNKEINK